MSVISVFSKGGGRGRSAAGTSSGDPNGSKWAARRSELQKFHSKLRQAPEHVQQKWSGITQLAGRDHAKAKQKQEFMQKLIEDSSYTDRYWTQEIEFKNSSTRRTKAKWLPRSRVDQLMGSASATQHAIDIGYFPTRTIRCANGQFEQVKYFEEQDIDDETNTHLERGRAGGSLDKAPTTAQHTVASVQQHILSSRKPDSAQAYLKSKDFGNRRTGMQDVL